MEAEETAAPPLPEPVRPARRPTLAAVLSFVWPGLGQAYQRRRRTAILYALPAAVVIALIVVFLLAVGPVLFVAYLLNPATAIGLLIVVVALGIWRAAAIIDAARGPRTSSTEAGSDTSRRVRPLTAVTVVALLLLVVVSHGWLSYTLLAFYRAGQTIYEPPAVAAHASPSPSVAATAGPASTPDGTAQPATTPSAAVTPSPQPTQPLPGVNRRVTILFIGVDNTHGPERGLTDTLIVASFDPATQSVAMISLPRDTAQLPFYAGGTWEPRINSLMQAATRDPERFPDGALPTLVNEVSYIVGIPIDYYARIDISGFTQMIDLVGGVDVTLENEINDPGYQFSPDEIGFHLLPGTYHLDGKLATAYARSRHGTGNSDWQRARRQQQILLALRQKVDDPLILANLPALLDSVSQIVRTDVPLDRLPEVVSIVKQSTGAGTNQYVLNPPHYAQPIFSASGRRTYAYELKMDAVAALSIELFGSQSRYAARSP